jgi:HEAT repeat protein
LRSILLSFFLSTTALAAPTSLAAVRSALEEPREEPLTAEGWRFLGEDVDAKLVETARDVRVPLATRVRAVWALGTLGTETAHRYLSHVVLTEDVEPPLVAAAIESFAQAFKATHRSEATQLAADHLKHSEAPVRSAAARALGRIGSEDARKALAGRQGLERDVAVNAEISFALKASVATR